MDEMQKKREEFMTKRANELKVFAKNTILSKQIPELVYELMYVEFGTKIPTYESCIPITFIQAWKAVLNFVKEQPVDEFSIDVAGVTLEYVTDISESDKSTNIVPQMFHHKLGLFKKNDRTAVPGSEYNDNLSERLNVWRTVNLTEHLTSIEEKVFAELLNTYGIDLRVSAIILPLLSAIYTVAITLAKSSNQTINLYNYFEIDVYSTEDGEDKVVITPLSPIKQAVKNDDQK